jgi:hypothetical protein
MASNGGVMAKPVPGKTNLHGTGQMPTAGSRVTVATS